MDKNQEREAFEAWLQKCHPGAVGTELIGKEENTPDSYVYFGVNKQWRAWQARAAIAATPAPAEPVCQGCGDPDAPWSAKRLDDTQDKFCDECRPGDAMKLAATPAPAPQDGLFPCKRAGCMAPEISCAAGESSPGERRHFPTAALAATPAPADRIPVPTNADQAAAMALLGEAWLRENAPERLKAATPAPAPAQAQQADLLRLFTSYGNAMYRNDPEAAEQIAQRFSAAQAATPAPAPQWVPVSERMPDANRKVLATYTNELGNRRTIVARWTPAKTVEADTDDDEGVAEYDEATDTYYLREGWWEAINNWGDYSQVFVNEGKVDHWMPLPAAPEAGQGKEAATPAPEQGRRVGVVRLGVRQHPYAVLETCFDEHGEHLKDGAPLFAAPVTQAQPHPDTADAERYRWLKEQGHKGGGDFYFRATGQVPHDKLDAAIDAARGIGGGNG